MTYRMSRRRFLRYAGLAGLSLLSGRAAAPLFGGQSNRAQADESHQVYLPLIAKVPPIPPLSQELVQEAYGFYSLGDPVPPASLRFEFKPNLNNPDRPAIVFARDPETGEIILATRFTPETQEQEWHVAKLRDLADAVGIRVGTNFFCPYVTGTQGAPPNIIEIVGELAIDNLNHALIDAFAWSSIELAPGTFDFTQCEQRISAAEQYGMTIESDPLVYGAREFSWGWLDEYVENAQNGGLSREQIRQELIEIMTNHIINVVSHFIGRVNAYRVVNEYATNEWDPLSTWIGPDYVYFAFEAARQADPDAKLILNLNGPPRRDVFAFQEQKPIVDEWCCTQEVGPDSTVKVDLLRQIG